MPPGGVKRFGGDSFFLAESERRVYTMNRMDEEIFPLTYDQTAWRETVGEREKCKDLRRKYGVNTHYISYALWL